MRMQGIADDFDERVKGHIVPRSQVQHSLGVLSRRRRVVQQGPTTVKDRSPNVFRHVQARDVRGTQGRYHEYELEVRQSGIVNVECLHNRRVFY